MSEAMRLDSERVDLLLLARLCPPRKTALSRGELERELLRLLESRLGRDAVRTLAAERVAALRAQGLVDSKRLLPTDAGRARVREALGTDTLPARWSTLRSKLVVALGLAVAAGGPRERLRDPDRLRARILRDAYELPVAAAPTLTQAIDALVWKQLGIESSEPLSLAKIRAHFLHQVLGSTSRLPAHKLATALAARSVGASSGHTDQLRAALLRDWLTAQQPQQPELAEAPPKSDALESFAAQVTAAASAERQARFGDRKVFISALWRSLRAHPAVAPMSEDDFKARLVEANRAGLLTLHRADLVGAMDPREVAASETRYLNATFHFVEAEQGGEA